MGRGFRDSYRISWLAAHRGVRPSDARSVNPNPEHPQTLTGQMTGATVRYDFSMKKRVVTAMELKAKCLALLDEVDSRGDTVVVTKRGRPVAVLQPVKKKPWKSPKGAWTGKVEIVGDIVNLNSSHLWETLDEH